MAEKPDKLLFLARIWNACKSDMDVKKKEYNKMYRKDQFFAIVHNLFRMQLYICAGEPEIQLAET